MVECRRYTTSKDNQRNMGGLAYTIKDTGAGGSIHISPLGLQEGAARLAACENIVEVLLNANATPEEFRMKFLGHLKIGLLERVSVKMETSLRVIHRDKDGNVLSDEEIDLKGE